jgi:phage terminase large subunit GpA-like protein
MKDYDFNNPHYKRFLEFHRLNPKVYTLLVEGAKKVKAVGYKRYSINTLFEIVRWHNDIDTKGDEFKLNNNHRAFYARMIMKNNPELDGMFRTRR